MRSDGFRRYSIPCCLTYQTVEKSDNHERLDHYNGLLLLPNLDKVFDLGFITFSEVGQIIMSSSLKNAEIIGVERTMRLDLSDQHQSYMNFHREHVFERLI